MNSRLAWFAVACGLVSVLVPAPGAAQGDAWTGYELALAGPSEVRAGRTARYRGVAYRVRGLAELVPFEGRVSARVGWGERSGAEPWVDVRSDAEGRFVVEVPVPEGAAEGGPRLEVRVGPDDDREPRVFDLRVTPGLTLMLRTDRRLYEPGEPVHVWGLLRDVASRRPVPGREVRVLVQGDALPATRRTVETDRAGVLHLELAVPDDAPEGSQSVTARVEGQLEARAAFRVGTRTYERLFAEVEVEPEPVAPNAPATVRVQVRTPSGAPVRDASVTVELEERAPTRATTGPDGRAEPEVRAPAYLEHETGRIPVRVRVSHPAHGSVRTAATMRLAVPLALEIETVAPHGGLVPEVDDVLWVRLADGVGEPPPEGTELTVEGPAIRGGRATASTDAHGLAEVPVRLPVGAASSRAGEPRTMVEVRVAGPLARTARIAVPVLRAAELTVTPDAVVRAPGDPLEVRIARRPDVEGLPAVAELLDGRGEPLRVREVAPGATSVRFDLPADRLGVLSVRVRVVHEAESLEAAGSVAAVLVRPPDPFEVRLDPVRERWMVGETARVRLHTGSGGPARFAAVLVRDLAAHGGEVPFERRFLSDAFDRAVLDPAMPGAERLVRAALAAHAAADPAPRLAPALVDALGLPRGPETLGGPPGRHVLRDPWPRAHELARRGIATPMRAVEARLARALDTGTLDEVTTVAGGERRFREGVLPGGDDAPKTLGGGPITPSLLAAADPSFTYDHVAGRVARRRLVALMAALAVYLDPGDDAPPASRMAAREPWARWLPRMVERGVVDDRALDDPWGGRFALRRTRSPALVLSARATDLELVSAGPDGRFGTRDDVRDPFARVVPAGTPYAVASGEDRLMRRLAALSPLARTLEALREAYRRVNVEMSEEEIGDAVSADVSQGTIGLGNLGTIGHGGGGGSGSGYGRGAGGLGLRGTGRGGGGRGVAGARGLAALVRERFPPTLLFAPAMALDGSGTSEIEIPLADAVTTYLVEAIVWREDGWIDSASARVSVDREVVVEAPVPDVAHRGDRLRLPVRVQNRGAAARTLSVGLLGDETLGVPDAPSRTVEVPAGDAVVVPVEVAPSRVGEGRLTAVVRDPDGEAVDAVRRSMRVLAPARRIERTSEALADGAATLGLAVPADADPRRGAIRLTAGAALFDGSGAEGPWASWAPSAGAGARLRLRLRRRDPVSYAFEIGAAWGDEALSDARLEQETRRLLRRLERDARDAEPPARVRQRALALLGLAPAARAPDRRDGADAVLELVARLREEVSASAVELSDAPEAQVAAAAALGWARDDDDSGARVEELLRRARRHAVRVGSDRWLPTERRPVRATLLWAMAELSLGHRDRAFGIVATVGRWAAREHDLAADERALGRALVRRLLDGREPSRVEVWVDGARHEVTLEHGAGRLSVPSLAAPGRHRVRVRVPEGGPVWVRASARFGVDWARPPLAPGPFALSLEGEVGGLDQVSELALEVRNRMPRTLAAPVIEVELPTGAELPARELAAVREVVRRVERGGGILTLHLAPMRPGDERRIPLPLRWSVAGRLTGLAVAARASDRPGAVSILRPRTLAIEEAEGDR